MRLESVDVESSYHGEYEARVTFVTNDPSDVRYLLDNKTKEFAAVTSSWQNDGLAAMWYLTSNRCSGKTVRVVKDGVIFNPPATILIKNGKKYVSKAHDEEFDEEKGLLMCLAKASGITHLELKRMIKNAKRYDKK